MTVSANFTSYIGEDVDVPDTIYSDAAETTPANITGWSVQFVAHLLGGPAVITQTTSNAGIVLTTPLSGVLTVSIPGSLTVGLAAGVYAFRIERTDVDAVLTTGSWFLLQR